MLHLSGFRICIALCISIALTGCGGRPHSASATPPPPSHQQQTMTITAPALYTEHSYRGTPDLGLTLAIVQAGGGRTLQ